MSDSWHPTEYMKGPSKVVKAGGWAERELGHELWHALPMYSDGKLNHFLPMSEHATAEEAMRACDKALDELVHVAAPKE